MHDDAWWCMIIDDSQWFMIITDAWFIIMNDAWWSMMDHDSWCMMLHDHWCFTMMNDHRWCMIHDHERCMIIHDASWHRIHRGSPLMAWRGGGKNLTARIAPDILGSNMGTKMVPVGALNASTISKCTALRDEAVRDDGRSPNPLFGVETEGFHVNSFGRFLIDFLGCP